MKYIIKKYQAVDYIVSVKILFLFLSVFAYFSHPHIIRQLDTLGITLRYWLRWTIEPTLNYPLYPALIQAGDAYGIHATEFPIIYVMLAPIFSLPNPWNIFLAKFLFTTMNLGLTYVSFNIWNKIHFENINFKFVHKIMLVFGISSVYVGRFMPDYPALILVLIAIGLSFHKIRYISLPIATMGLLIKPTAILAFAPLLLKNRDELFRQILIWILPATIIALLYYTWGVNNLNSISDIPRYFYSNFRNPIVQIFNFFIDFKKIPSLFLKNIFTGYILVFLIWDFFKSKFKMMKFWLLLILQVLGGAALDGSHSYIHNYYFIATSFIVSIIFCDFIERQTKKIKIFVYVLLVASVLDAGIYENYSTFSKDNKLWQCAQIKRKILNENPSVYKIRNSQDHRADLGTCMSLIQNSKTAKFGVYYKNNIPKEGDIIFETKDLVLKKFE